MVLNLVALACMGGAVIGAMVLFCRYARRMNVPGGAPNVCLRCGTPAEALVSFTCPGCNRDVREAGLGPRRLRSPVARFWYVVAFTCLFLVAAGIASNVLSNNVPRVTTVSRNASLTLALPQIRGVELSLDGSGVHEGELEGTVSGELYGTGGAVLLEIDRPSLRWRLLDPAGKELDGGAKPDGKMVYRWMELGGAPTDTPEAHSDAAHIAEALKPLVGFELEMPPVPGTGRALSLTYSMSSGGGSFSEVDPRWPPLFIVAASGVWIACIYRVTRPRRRRSAPVPPAPAAAAAEGVTP